MIGFIIRPLRALGRAAGRTSIVKREQQTLTDTRKVLLTFRSARENSKAEVTKYRERVARLTAQLAVEQARPVEKRSFDWARFDQNTLLTAIKDDLYEAEKKLHEELANYEHNDYQVQMFEARELRVTASLEMRTGMAEVPRLATLQAADEQIELSAGGDNKRVSIADLARHASQQGGVEYDPANGRIDLTPPRKHGIEVPQARPEVDLARFGSISPSAA